MTRRKKKYRQVYRKKRWKSKKPEKPKSKVKRAYKYLTKKETKEKVSRGMIRAQRFFEGMGQGLDEAMGIPMRHPDYNLPRKKYKKRRRSKK